MITLRIAQKGDEIGIYEVMCRCSNALSDAETFVCDDIDFVKEHIENRGFICVATDEGKIVSYFIFRFPGDDLDNLGNDAGLLKTEFRSVAHAESAGVLPDYRGKHLQREMLYFGIERIRKAGYKYIMATASPKNAASCKTLEKAGLSCVVTKEKYGGLIRNIYLLRL